LRKRKRNSFARIGALCVVLLIALGAMGTAYGVWSETFNIASMIETGLIDTELDWIGSECVPPTSGTGIGGYAEDMTLQVTVIKAQLNVDYYCYFNIDNYTGFGTLPVKIDSYDIDESYTGVVPEITGVVLGEQIDPGQTIYDSELHIYLTDATNQDQNLYFTVTISVVLWNQ